MSKNGRWLNSPPCHFAHKIIYSLCRTHSPYACQPFGCLPNGLEWNFYTELCCLLPYIILSLFPIHIVYFCISIRCKIGCINYSDDLTDYLYAVIFCESHSSVSLIVRVQTVFLAFFDVCLVSYQESSERFAPLRPGDRVSGYWRKQLWDRYNEMRIHSICKRIRCGGYAAGDMQHRLYDLSLHGQWFQADKDARLRWQLLWLSLWAEGRMSDKTGRNIKRACVMKRPPPLLRWELPERSASNWWRKYSKFKLNNISKAHCFV